MKFIEQNKIYLIFILFLLFNSCKTYKFQIYNEKMTVSQYRDFKVILIKNVQKYDNFSIQHSTNINNQSDYLYNIFQKELKSGNSNILFFYHKYDIGEAYADWDFCIYIDSLYNTKIPKLKFAFFSEYDSATNLWYLSSGFLEINKKNNDDFKIEFDLNFEKLFGATNDFENTFKLNNEYNSFGIKGKCEVDNTNTIDLKKEKQTFALINLIN